jgi:hypothetical protein
MTPGEANDDRIAEIAALREHVTSLDRRITELQAALSQSQSQVAEAVEQHRQRPVKSFE